MSRHPRAVEKAEREKAAKLIARAEAEKAKEDARWVDDDKTLKLKQERQLAREQQAQIQDQKEREKRELLEQDAKLFANCAKNTKSALSSQKVKRSDIQISALNHIVTAPKKKAAPSVQLVNDMPLIPITNREILDDSVVDATGLDDALRQLRVTVPSEIDPHPERRMKALFKAYEERRMTELKLSDEGKTLKRSQLKEKIFKEWLKSPENPMFISNR
jgi:Coiled-coil domain-containing protein 124 /Oxs1